MNRFLDNFVLDGTSSVIPGSLDREPLRDVFFKQYGGKSFSRGLYRTLDASVSKYMMSFLIRAFPQFSDRIGFCFGVDWVGRVFALDTARDDKQGESLVLLLERGTGEALEIPATLESFHDDEIVRDADPALASNFHAEWLAHGNRAPEVTECVGYKKPLFLGGSDTIENLELIDLDVYWEISTQLINKMRGQKPGTRIDQVSID